MVLGRAARAGCRWLSLISCYFEVILLAQIEREEQAGVLLDQFVRCDHAKGKLSTKLRQMRGFISKVLTVGRHHRSQTKRVSVDLDFGELALSKNTIVCRGVSYRVPTHSICNVSVICSDALPYSTKLSMGSITKRIAQGAHTVGAEVLAAGARRVRLILLGGMVLSFTLNTGCSIKPDLPEAEVRVKDPISFDVKGIDGEIGTNVEAHLNSLAVISKERVRFYMREIEDTSTAALRAFGYYHPKIEVELPDPENAKDRTVVVNVDVGKPLYIRNYVVQILGEGSRYKIFEDITNENSLNTYHPLNHGQYEQFKQKIHEQAMSLGFFDGKFISSRILVYQDQNMADIEIIYDTGPRYRFGKLVLDKESEQLLKPSKNLQSWKDGDYFATSKISSFIQSLNQTNYYNIVDVRPLIDERADQKTPIAIHLERRANNNVRLGIGYSTDEGPRVMMEWNKPLLNERGDSFSSLMTLTPVTQEAQFIYKIPRKNPNLNYYTLNASQEHIDLNDTKSNRSQLAVHYIANDQGKWRQDYALRLEYEDYDQGGETGHALNFIPALRFSRRETSGGFDPVKGYSLSLEALGASETVMSDNTFVQVKATYKGVMSPSPTTRFVFRLEQGANFGPDAETVPPSLRFFAGGDNSIRGFGYRDKAPTQPFGSGLKGARYMTTGTAEYQFPIGVANSRLAVFVDGGIVTDDYNSDWNILWGPGIGYRYISPYGTVRVDLASGFESGQDNSYQLHFAFGPEF